MVAYLLLGLAGFAAGFINAVAGGGSLVSFPALMAAGLSPVAANATSTLALWPGSLSSVYAYRREIGADRRRALVLALPSLLGGLAGAILLLATPERAFRVLVPWLILFACALIVLQGPITRRVARAARPRLVPPALWLAQLAISVYGGYFGAGIGILMLAALGIFLGGELPKANALKVLFAMVINGVALLYFLLRGAAHLPSAGVMALASIVGGYLGARVARRLPASVLRVAVVLIGTAVAVQLFRRG